MKALIRKALRLTSFEITRKHPIETKSRAIFGRYAQYTMIPEPLFIDNLKLIWNFKHIQGCVVECGVWRGGMSAGMAEVLVDREFFLFDSFEGLPPAKQIDGERALAWQANKEGATYFDNCKAEMEIAEKAIRRTGVKFNLVKGWFNETLPLADFREPIAVLRLDGDWYESTMECLKTLFPLVATGGIVILDDYYTWDGCSRAVHEYLATHSLTARLHKTPAGTPYLIKKD